MTAKGHILLASTLAYMPFVYILENHSFKEALVFFVMAIVGSLLPDIDEPRSYIGGKSIYLAEFLHLLGLKHRTITHWLITPLLIASCGYFVEHEFVSLVIFSIAFGILAHDIGDLLTNGGIGGFLFPFFPNTKIVLLPKVLRFETFSFVEMIFNALLFCANIYLYTMLTIRLVP